MYLLGDCLEKLKEIPAGSVDLVLCDPPYGTTRNKWDTVIPLDALWPLLKRAGKPTAAYVFTASQPFTTVLAASNLAALKYSWVWQKTVVTGHLNVKKMPMRAHEDVLVFRDSPGTYNPQGLEPYGRVKKRGHNGSNYGASGAENFQEVTGYPTTLLPIASARKTVHPTQKPVELMEYLIKTYTNPGETVLDFTMGSGTTGVAALRTGRHFIGIEKDPGYYQIALERIAGALCEC